VDKLKKTGPKDNLATLVAISKSADDVAKIVGTNRGKVARARTIIDHTPEPIKESVESQAPGNRVMARLPPCRNHAPFARTLRELPVIKGTGCPAHQSATGPHTITNAPRFILNARRRTPPHREQPRKPGHEKHPFQVVSKK